jgi:hypothetical protein
MQVHVAHYRSSQSDVTIIDETDSSAINFVFEHTLSTLITLFSSFLNWKISGFPYTRPSSYHKSTYSNEFNGIKVFLTLRVTGRVSIWVWKYRHNACVLEYVEAFLRLLCYFMSIQNNAVADHQPWKWSNYYYAVLVKKRNPGGPNWWDHNKTLKLELPSPVLLIISILAQNLENPERNMECRLLVA